MQTTDTAAPVPGPRAEPLSVCVTTFNNARTLDACLKSVAWADEILVLDSFSTDRTREIASAYGCRIIQHAFLGHGRQKQMALDHTTHDWVLLLDADEALTPELAQEIQSLLAMGPKADGYTLFRNEQVFWRMTAPGTRMNDFLRLFNRHKGYISDWPVHAAPQVRGRVERLKGAFYHYGGTDIHTQVEKVNACSTGLAADRLARGRPAWPWLAIAYPPVHFLRVYVLKRNFLGGWAGLYASVVSAFQVFLMYAKMHEQRCFERHGTALMPEGAPRPPKRGGGTA
jgi:glycosyltransferase involved in cell wall biosynthesis